MKEKAKSIFFALLRSVLYGDRLTDNEKAEFTAEVLPEIYKIARKHDLAHILLRALNENGIVLSDSEWQARLEHLQFQAVYRYEQSVYELSEISEILSKGNIPFIPLKGAIIRNYYPEAWMRTSCDIDVLVHEEDLDRAVSLLTEGGWIAKEKRDYHDISLTSQSGAHLELHFNIRENMNNLDTVLDKVWEYSAPTESGSCEYRQSNEFLMFHLLAHMSYHFVAGGCGIRSFMDICLLREKISFSDSALYGLCESANITAFYDNVIALCGVWFGKESHTDITKQIEHYVISGGVYGSSENRIAVDQARAGGKRKNLVRRIFMPYDTLKIKYPKLDGHKWRTPFYQILRWWHMLTKGRLKKSINELNINNSKTDAEIRETEIFLNSIGLKNR